MPVLPFSDMLTPPDLFAAPPSRTDRAWWVLHTRPRAEKVLAEHVARAGASYFLPQYARTRHRSGRVRTSYLPLFPGYLFLYGTPEDRLKALKSNLVANSLAVPDQPKLYRQLAQVYRVMTHDLAGCRPQDDPRVGSLVEITAGPFAGLEGRVVEAAGGYTFVVEVEFIGRGVAVTVDHWMFRTLSGPPHVSTTVASPK